MIRVTNVHSGRGEIPRSFEAPQDMLQATQGFVMPANAGIQVRFRYKLKRRLDSGFRRKDGIRVDFQSTNSEAGGV